MTEILQKMCFKQRQKSQFFLQYTATPEIKAYRILSLTFIFLYC